MVKERRSNTTRREDDDILLRSILDRIAKIEGSVNSIVNDHNKDRDRNLESRDKLILTMQHLEKKMTLMERQTASRDTLVNNLGGMVEKIDLMYAQFTNNAVVAENDKKRMDRVILWGGFIRAVLIILAAIRVILFWG